MIKFVSDGQNHSLDSGEYFARPREIGFRDTAADDLLSLVSKIESGRAWREVVDARYQSTKPWLHSIITSESRIAFFGEVLPSGTGVVLDIGSGWGQIARPLARHRPVVALEPVAERLAFIMAAAKQDGVAKQMTFVEADYFDLQFHTRFAAICAIGVFEWSGSFQDHADPQTRQQAFLRKARSELADDGTLIIGIENRLGLKYLLGCPDDHIGVPSIACLPAELARQRWKQTSGQELQCFTYSLIELQQLLHAAGFSRVEFFATFPDYKLPTKIIPLADGNDILEAWLQSKPVSPEHNGYDGSPLDRTFQQNLQIQYQRLAAAGVAHHHVPSFFVRAS